MALAEKKISNFASYQGTASSDTAWDKLQWDFDARNLKVVINAASTSGLEISLNGTDVHCTLPPPSANQNPMCYDFSNIGISRLFVRKTGAVVGIYAYAPN